MIAVIVLISCTTFIAVAVKVSRSTFAQSAIYSEFNQSKAIAFLVWLLPIGFGLASYMQKTLGKVIPLVLASICFFIVFLSAKKLSKAFEASGTSRTREVLNSVNQVILFVILGFVYIGIKIAFIILEFGLSDNYIS